MSDTKVAEKVKAEAAPTMPPMTPDQVDAEKWSKIDAVAEALGVRISFRTSVVPSQVDGGRILIEPHTTLVLVPISEGS